MVAEVVGKRPPAWALPAAVTNMAGWAGRLGQRIDAHRFAGLDPHVLRSMSAERYRTDRRAQTELGLVSTPLQEAIVSAYEWFSERGYC